jgi:hypothetical protein
MRKHQRQQLLELLQTVREAHRAGMYAAAQEGALAAGEFIENIEGADSPRVSGVIALLEEYCELLYRVAAGGGSGAGELDGRMSGIESAVRDELAPDKIEIAFISYKPDMSDSLESVYLAASDDPLCDAYWIPVPWFEKTPDGSLGAMRYEGAEMYPGYMDCADWRWYDVASRRPDAIFTFNPYDGTNFVTSIHPDFYCERLRRYTGLLCYVPYFVAVRKSVPEDFATRPGTVYAHKVFVQSEAVRRSYVSQYRREYGSPEEKFVALGSPKIDKAVGAARGDAAIPAEWARAINGRRVIFFNTSLGALLAGNELYLDALRSALGVFRAREDIALWWRPHPLTETTYASMRPGLLGEYRTIAERYGREGWGVYDDTPDLHRAIAYADAYYGDPSSVIALFGAAGKPVLVRPKYGAGAQPGERYFAYCLKDGDLEAWLDGAAELRPHTTFSAATGYEYAKGGSGAAIYDYCRKLLS